MLINIFYIYVYIKKRMLRQSFHGSTIKYENSDKPQVNVNIHLKTKHTKVTSSAQ